MLSNQRQKEILQVVKERGTYKITDLAERFSVSTETIRRNLKSLADKGLVAKFHGGVTLPTAEDEPPFQRRMQLNREQKQRVAAAAVALIRDGDSLILDSGTTTSYVADALANHTGLVIVTNSADVACRLASRNDNRVFLAGGEISPEGLAAFSATAITFLRQFRVRYTLLTVAGISDRGDFAHFHLWEAEFAQAAIEQADETWVIADHSKFGRNAPVRLGSLDDVTAIITDQPPPASFAEQCALKNVAICLPPD
ncbi:DeoR/GlpR family DNA-binding transcription regulator [Methylovirgula sp. 4M-Z18]|uniref:DeoR/GlpR family DNA-binding transcription regulator n=1 Tax=Methylovirgula sp. 4M-Z18 TaxID=2293567 RepID=UPI001313F95C|nr:DeoR/GlpR family DNA-binding transcription regulator [Methylovirgula sp. 4M-Z18]